MAGPTPVKPKRGRPRKGPPKPPVKPTFGYKGNVVETFGDRWYVKLAGSDAAVRSLKELEPKVARAVTKKGMRDSAKVFADWARYFAPVRSGAMRKGIKVRATKRSRKGNFIVVQLRRSGDGTGKFYAPFREFDLKGRRPPHKVKAHTRAAHKVKAHTRGGSRVRAYQLDTQHVQAHTRKSPHAKGSHFLLRAFKSQRKVAKAILVDTIKAAVLEHRQGQTS